MTRTMVLGVMKILVMMVFVESFGYTRGQEDLHDFLSVKMDFSNSEKISEKCVSEMRLMHNSLKNLTLWAMEMWEATARESPSILEGTNYQMGNFDECISPVDRYDYEKGPERQYCLVNVKIKFNSPRIFNDSTSIFNPHGNALDKIYGNGEPSMVGRDNLYWAVCTPASCLPSDIVTMINRHFETSSAKTNALNLTLSASLTDEWCHQDDSKSSYSGGAITFIIVLSLLCALAVSATAYHWYTEYGRTTENKKVQCPNLVKCFSIVFHLNQLNYKGSAEAGLEALNSIRVMAISFVIIGHRVGTLTQGPLINRENYENEYYVLRGAVVRQTDIFVDMFFILSGMLCMYHLLKRTQNQRINYGFIILHRYLRLVPLYAFAIFFTATLLPTTGTGPFWKPIMENEGQYCRENWWTNILMISNYVNVDRMCILHTWYIPCDFHFFIMAVIASFILKKDSWRKMGLIIMGIVLFISVLIPILITYFMKLDATLFFYYQFLIAPRLDPTFQHMYIKSHARFSPYLLGMLGGYILFKFHKPGEKRFSRLVSTLGGVTSIILLIVFLLSTWRVYKVDEDLNPILSALFSGLHRPVKSFLTCTLILFCVFGSIPFISSFLNWRPWMILSKLTYGAYLFHMSLQIRDAAMLRQPFYFNYIYMYFKLSLGDIVVSFFLSFVFYLLIEGPSNQLIRAMMTPPNTKPRENKSTSGHTNDALELEKSDTKPSLKMQNSTSININ
ncbi:nose resistant to fluoxetine protein 6-like [Arctopsyche grandis]|uniref:nose resistant to fluoxetine protein 6-like n=1 Tax=Arctopsyche grandis TaxID=121162 RepID=UPI00406D742E